MPPARAGPAARRALLAWARPRLFVAGLFSTPECMHTKVGKPASRFRMARLFLVCSLLAVAHCFHEVGGCTGRLARPSSPRPQRQPRRSVAPVPHTPRSRVVLANASLCNGPSTERESPHVISLISRQTLRSRHGRI